MDPIELHQFIRILAIAIGALVAAPIVAYLAGSSDDRAERRHRKISTQHPVMQY